MIDKADPAAPTDGLARGSAGTLTLAFSVACLGLAAWFVFHLKPYPAALIAAVAPILAGALIVWAFKGAVVWFAASPSKPTVAAAVLPALAIAVATTLTVRLDQPLLLAVASAVVGLVVACIVFARIRTSRAAATVALGLIGAVVAYGLVALADVGLDRGPGRIYAAQVNHKQMIGGHRPGYVLDLGPWGDRPAARVNVALGVYGAVEVGGTMCFTQHRGALGLPWTDLEVCKLG